MLESLMSFFFAMDVNWSGILTPIGDMVDGLVGDPAIIGVIVFLFFFMFALVLYIPFEGVVVIMMPTLFAVFAYIPMLRIIVGVMVGLLIGIALLKWVRR